MNSPTWTTKEAEQAIQARINGVFDDPQLRKLGPLSTVDFDVARIEASVCDDAGES